MAKRVYVGIGHGGYDSGAIGNGFKEKDLTLSIGKYCNERTALKQKSAVLPIVTHQSIQRLPLPMRLMLMSAWIST